MSTPRYTEAARDLLNAETLELDTGSLLRIAEQAGTFADIDGIRWRIARALMDRAAAINSEIPAGERAAALLAAGATEYAGRVQVPVVYNAGRVGLVAVDQEGGTLYDIKDGDDHRRFGCAYHAAEKLVRPRPHTARGAMLPASVLPPGRTRR